MIGEEVRRQREELGLTGAQLAARASLAPSAVSQIETGRRNPSSMSVMKLADALGVEVGELYPNKAQAPLPLEESERDVTPGIPFSAERALTLADSDSFRREAKAASVEELQQVALELARFVEVPIREEWVEERQAGRKAWREKGHRREMAALAIATINAELNLSRDVRSPVELAIKQRNEVIATPEETAQGAHEEQESHEAG